MKPIALCVAALAVSGLVASTASAQALQKGIDPNLFTATPPAPPAAHPIPTIDTTGDAENVSSVNYLTGGIGDDERLAIEAAKADYNVHITNNSGKGAFVSDARVVIRDKTGAQLLSVNAGPLLYVQLPAGSYTVDATHYGHQQHKKITVGKKGGANTGFSWAIPVGVE